METIKTYNGQSFRVVRGRVSLSTTQYTVHKIEGEWPDDRVIADLCDEFRIKADIRLHDDYADVTIYTD